jgi:hypothetical protein
MINHRAKRDFQSAKKDFEVFLRAADPRRFSTQVAVVQDWLAEINDSLAVDATAAPIRFT